jgi:hypothetical protein
MNDNQYLKQVDNILKHEVSRAEFIKYIGVAFVSVLGVTSFLKSLHGNLLPSPTTSSKKSVGGYGSSPYGR